MTDLELAAANTFKSNYKNAKVNSSKTPTIKKKEMTAKSVQGH